MLPSLVHKSTIVLAIALIGLVGGIGTGLHWVFGCSHHCHCSDSHCSNSGSDCCPSSFSSAASGSCSAFSGDGSCGDGSSADGSCGHASPGHASCSSNHCNSRFCQRESSNGPAQESSSSAQDTGGTLAEADHDCAICHLLSQFHSSSIDSPALQVAWGQRDSLALSVPDVIAHSSLRLEHPRGPPSDCS